MANWDAKGGSSSQELGEPEAPEGRLQLGVRLHDELPWITLPASAVVPPRSRRGTREATDRLEALLQKCEGSARTLGPAATCRDEPSPALAAADAAPFAWKRFFRAHFAFFYTFCWLAELYRQAESALVVEDEEGVDVAMRRAGALWRLAGAWMVYGVDFHPTEGLYKGHIRPVMDEALSGTWLREYQQLHTRQLHLHALIGADPLRCNAGHRLSLLQRAERDYRRLHGQVMRACVPELVSKLQLYQSEHGEFRLGEEHLASYDRWFHIDRVPGQGLATFLESQSVALGTALEDIRVQHRLGQEVLGLIGAGALLLNELSRERMLMPPGKPLRGASHPMGPAVARAQLSAASRFPVGGILACVGNTPLVKLERYLGATGFELFAKLEGMNPAGSAKDRAALAVVCSALESGILRPGSVVIDSSAGDMGVGLAQVCRYFGLRFICVVDSKTSPATIEILRAYGAEVSRVVDPETGDILQARLKRVQDLRAAHPASFWPNQQAGRENSRSRYETTMPEILRDCGEVDYLFVATSSSGTIRGCQEYIRDYRLATKLVAVDTLASPAFAGGWVERGESLHEVVKVSDLESVVGCRRLLQREAILAGASSGGVLAAVERLADSVAPGARCVAVLEDRGERYLETVYSDRWVNEHFGDVARLWSSTPAESIGSAG